MSAVDPITTIPTKSTPDIGWQAWYDSLPFAESTNNVLFAEAWKVRGSNQANTEALRNYLKGHNITLASNSTLEDAWEAVKSPIQSIGDFLKMSEDAMFISGGVILLVIAGVIWRLATPETVSQIMPIAEGAAIAA